MVDVLVVGAGPVGLVMAAELVRHGARVRIVDKAPAPSVYCRAIGVTPRTLEVFEDMGIVRSMIDAGLWLEGVRIEVKGMASRTQPQDLSDLPYGSLGLPQPETERLLAAHLSRSGVEVERGVGFASLRQDGEGVQVELAHPDGTTEVVRVAYVVGCDGAHSTVRHALGIAFEGDAFPYPFMLGDVHADWSADSGLPQGYALRSMVVHDDAPPDLFIAIPLPEHGRYRVSMMADPAPDGSAGEGVAHGIQADQPGVTLEALQAVADRVMTRPPKLSDLRWSSRFRISMRLADRYCVGRAFIAGDAAHIHPPTGGQGMNTGIQDAYNLAWKLGLVLTGKADARLLDSYEAERRPVARDVIARTTEESVNLGRSGKPRDRLADTQILLNYRGVHGFSDHGAQAPPGSPLAGDRAPDAQGLRRRGVGFPLRLFDLTCGTEFVLLVVTQSDAAALAKLELEARALADIGLPLRMIAIMPSVVPDHASMDEGSASLPLPEPLGVALIHDADGRFEAQYQAAPGSAFLVRPDGYLAWTARPFDAEALGDFLRRMAKD